MQKHINLVDLVKSFQKNYTQYLFFKLDPNSNEYLVANIGFDTAENEPCKVCPHSAYRSPRSSRRRGAAAAAASTRSG